MFAGQVIDRYNRRPGNVWIRVVDLEDVREPKAAPIEKQTDERGYFSIAGLRPGGHYELIARVQDGDRLYSGTLFAKPPNPRLVIWVSEDPAGSGTPPPPQQQAVYPGRPEGGVRPAATLDTPVKDAVSPATAQPPPDPRPGAASAPAPSTNPVPSTPAATSPALDPTRTADTPPPAKDGFLTPPRPVPVNVPSETPVPPPPAFRPTTPAAPADAAPQQPQPAAPTPASQVLLENPPVPSCQLVGRKLVNLALYDHNGNVWEYRKDRAGRDRIGRLVLLDFWSSHCIPCLAAMPHLVELSQKYGPYGLDVVGIAYESGTMEQQVAQVRSVRGRYNVRYPSLLGAGQTCPVRTQFDIQAFPTLILIDANGEIVLRKEGLDGRGLQELEFEIHRRLLNTRQGS
jgi:thiol-disulfide isomerase/thioredoxin